MKRDEASLQQQQRIVIISYVAELGQTPTGWSAGDRLKGNSPPSRGSIHQLKPLKQQQKQTNLNMSDWVRLDITSFTKTTNRDKILKILKAAKVSEQLDSKSYLCTSSGDDLHVFLLFNVIWFQFVFCEKSVCSTSREIVLNLEFRWNAVRSRIRTWTQIETRTAFQLWSSELISKPRLQTTQV